MMDHRSPGEAALPPAQPGEIVTKSVCLSAADIVAFASQVNDLNPIHHDAAAARAAGYPGLIASGAHTGALFMAMTASHFSAPSPHGQARTVLGLGFDIRFRAPVFAGELITLRWTVTASAWKASLNGFLTRAMGEARTPRALVLSGTAQLLLRHA